jgi:hypothetical protein
VCRQLGGEGVDDGQILGNRTAETGDERLQVTVLGQLLDDDADTCCRLLRS